MTEELPAPPQKTRMNPDEMRNSDYVSRLLAATPPYLYSTPVGPNNFFFSDMLRSLVQARNTEQSNNRLLGSVHQMAVQRRQRKRTWSSARNFFDFEPKEERPNNTRMPETPDKPLELTNKIPQLGNYQSSKHHRSEECVSALNTLGTNEKSVTIDEEKKRSSHSYGLNSSVAQHTSPITSTSTVSPSSSSTVDNSIVPAPPLWYPSLYPPYGIDPLHFFIDLRVSGHIYDRKNENELDPTKNNNNNNHLMDSKSVIGKSRQGSAFSVPAPRVTNDKNSALNLTSTTMDDKKSCEYLGYNNNNYSKNTNYVLQNLPRIFTSPGGNDERHSECTESKSESDVQEVELNSGGDLYSNSSNRCDNPADYSNEDVEIVDDDVPTDHYRK